MDKLLSRKLKIPGYSHFCWVSCGGPQKPFTKGYFHLGKCTESHGIWQATGASARLPAREAGFHRLFLEARKTLTSREEGTVRVGEEHRDGGKGEEKTERRDMSKHRLRTRGLELKGKSGAHVRIFSWRPCPRYCSCRGLRAPGGRGKRERPGWWGPSLWHIWMHPLSPGAGRPAAHTLLPRLGAVRWRPDVSPGPAARGTQGRGAHCQVGCPPIPSGGCRRERSTPLTPVRLSGCCGEASCHNQQGRPSKVTRQRRPCNPRA